MPFPYDYDDTSNTITEQVVDDFTGELRKITNLGLGKEELAKAKTYQPNYTHAPDDDKADEGYEKDGYFRSENFYSPQIFGAPQPRFLVPTGSVYFHQQPYGWSNAACFQGDLTGAGDYQGISHSCARIKLRHKAIVNIMTSFYCFELGGMDYAESIEFGGLESRVAGKVALKVDDSVYSMSAWRYIHVANIDTFTNLGGFQPKSTHLNRNKMFFNMIGRHQHSISMQVNLDPGIHDIGLAVKASKQGMKNSMGMHWEPTDAIYGFKKAETPCFNVRKQMFFMNRNFVVDVNYTGNAD